MKKEYFIVPKDVIGIREEIVKGLRVDRDVETRGVCEDIVGQYTISEETLVIFDKNSFMVHISLAPITNAQLEDLQKQHKIYLNKYQLVIKIVLESTSEDKPRFLEFDSKLRKYIILSFLLATKGIAFCNYEYGKFIKIGTGGQGIFLPFAFIKLTPEGRVNLYYESSYEKMTYSYSYAIFEIAQITIMKELLDLFLIQEKRKITQPIEDMFIHINPISWIAEGFFYPALVTLFTCFESLLNKRFRQQIANLLGLTSGTPEHTLFLDLQKFRNGIAHTETHNIFRQGVNYACEKIRKEDGTPQTPSIITNFNIDKLEQIRVKLMELMIDKIRS